MQRGKSTCLPRLLAEILPQKLGLDFPRIARRLHDHTRQKKQTQIRKGNKIGKTEVKRL